MLINELKREYKRMNDECADKIADNRYSIDNSRDWLVDEGGVVDRIHRMSAKNVITTLLNYYQEKQSLKYTDT